jgi:hypothetical protein
MTPDKELSAVVAEMRTSARIFATHDPVAVTMWADHIERIATRLAAAPVAPTAPRTFTTDADWLKRKLAVTDDTGLTAGDGMLLQDFKTVPPPAAAVCPECLLSGEHQPWCKHRDECAPTQPSAAQLSDAEANYDRGYQRGLKEKVGAQVHDAAIDRALSPAERGE